MRQIVIDCFATFAVGFMVLIGASMVSFSESMHFNSTVAMILGFVIYLAGVFFTLWWVVTAKDMVFVWRTRTPPSWGYLVVKGLAVYTVFVLVVSAILIFNATGEKRQLGIFLGMAGADLFIALLFWYGYVQEYRERDQQKLCE